jgi:hypothetical protein
MATCQGKRQVAISCGGEVCRCHNCINVGCDQVADSGCSNQGFRSGICIRCGAPRVEGRLAMTPALESAMKKLGISLP